MLDLPEASAASFRRMAEAEEVPSVGTWREQCSPRYGWDFHPSIVVGHTAFFQIVRGYDEYYEVDRSTFEGFVADPTRAHELVASAKRVLPVKTA